MPIRAKEERKTAILDCRGGLALGDNPLEINPGRLIGCRNFRAKADGGYQRIAGYERYDGHPSPTEAADPAAARTLIAAVPGSGSTYVHMFKGVVYAFRNNAAGDECLMYKATVSGWEEVTTGATLDPDGVYYFINYNFYGNSTTECMYGCDGVNKPFQFDGTTFTQITVAGVTAEAIRLAAHKNHLFLAYPKGQWAHSVVGTPTDFSAVNGAGAGGIGDEIQSIIPTVGGELAFFCRNRITILYGSTLDDWAINDFGSVSEQSGAMGNTVQSIGSDLVYLDDRGLTTINQVASYGNFQTNTIDRDIRRMLEGRYDSVSFAFIARKTNEYRLVLVEDETEVITFTFGKGGIEGIGRCVYPIIPSSFCSLEDQDGTERIFAGCTDGFVYELDIGTSFDGAEYPSTFRSAYAHLGLPNNKKSFKLAKFVFESVDDFSFRCRPSFDYGSNKIAPHSIEGDDVYGGGSYWGTAVWGQFSWGTQIYPEASISIAGVSRSLSLMFHLSSATIEPITVKNITVTYSVRGIQR